MNKEEFLRGLNNLNEVDATVLENLVEASEAYPYCQNLHILIAKKYQETNHHKAAAKLHTAAIYAPDRQVLKKIMEDDPAYVSARNNFHERYQETKLQEAFSEPVREEEIVEVVAEPSLHKLTATHVIDKPVAVKFPKLLTSLGLIEEKLDFLTEPENKIEILEKPEIKEPGKDQNSVKDAENNIYDELEKTLQETKKRRSEGLQGTNTPQESLINKGESNEELIDHPLNNEEIKVDDSIIDPSEEIETIEEKSAEVEVKDQEEIKIKEQNQIIENFIKLNPTLSRFDLKFDEDQPTVEDLSIPKLVIGEHLVSENLAVILQKQGKIKKAVDVYEKLILKFPEKKAYFTSCIENIKNSK